MKRVIDLPTQGQADLFAAENGRPQARVGRRGLLLGGAAALVGLGTGGLGFGAPATAAGGLSRPAGPGVAVTGSFGPREPIWTPGGWSSDVHRGMDFGNGGGTFPVLAAADGTVVNSYYDGGAGPNPVTIHHPSVGVWTGYAHMASRSVNVGDTVRAGQVIGMAGAEGRATGIHLHFEVITKQPGTAGWFGSQVDPAPYLTGAAPPPSDNASPQGVLHEAGNALNWQAVAVGTPAIQGTRTAAISDRGGRVVYTIRGGRVMEAGNATGWNNLATPITGATDVAAISDAGGRVVYTVRDGRVMEAGNATGWNNLGTPITGVSKIAAISDAGGRVVYSVRGGQLWEAGNGTGWRNLYTGISGVTDVAAISDRGGRVVYTVRDGRVMEAGNATGWNNLGTPITGVTDLAAISDSGGRVVYSIRP